MASSRRAARGKDEDKDYGLRKRAKDSDDSSARARTPTVWEKFPTNSGFKSLTSKEVRGDLQALEELDDGDDDQPDEGNHVETLVGEGTKELGRFRKRRRKQTSNSKRVRELNKSPNYYYAYKRTKNREEELDYAEAVSEQVYQSVRHAYVRKLELAQKRRAEQRLVIENLREQLHEHVGARDGVEDLDITISIMQQALEKVKQCNERVGILKEENKSLRSFLEDYDRTQRTRKKARSSSKSKLSETKAKPKEVSTKTAVSIPDRFVNTCYGSGWIQKMRPNGMLEVQLNWGANAVISLNSLTPVSQELLEQVVEENKPEQETAEPVAKKDKVPLYTCTRSGPPRGVRLELSPVSDDLHFALHPPRPIDPEELQAYYNSHADLTKEKSMAEVYHGDWDCKAAFRIENTQEMLFSWAQEEYSPWAKEGKGLSKSELAEWENERWAHQRDVAKVSRLEHELRKLKAIGKVRDKRLLAFNQSHNMLLSRMTAVRTKYNTLQSTCIRLMKNGAQDPAALNPEDDSEHDADTGKKLKGKNGAVANGSSKASKKEVGKKGKKRSRSIDSEETTIRKLPPRRHRRRA